MTARTTTMSSSSMRDRGWSWREIQLGRVLAIVKVVYDLNGLTAEDWDKRSPKSTSLIF